MQSHVYADSSGHYFALYEGKSIDDAQASGRFIKCKQPWAIEQ
jgi:hypothetical protein